MLLGSHGSQDATRNSAYTARLPIQLHASHVYS